MEQLYNMYRAEECLWKTTLKEHSDKGKSNAAYERLILLCLTVEPIIGRSNRELLKNKFSPTQNEASNARQTQ